MSDAFRILLDATLQHLRELQGEGVSFVPVAAETLKNLRGGSHSSLVGGAKPRSAPGRTESISGTAAPVPQAPERVSLRKAEPGAGLAGRVGVVAPADAERSQPVELDARVGSAPGPVADRAAAMAALRERVVVCTQCPHLVKARTQVVFGVGSPEAELMFVGEAPGADEDRLGEPFVGRAGQLLTKIIAAMGYTRETVYIANILKCRPDLPEGGRGNRPPRPEEMDTCKPFLLRQIEIIRPRVIVALGNTAVQGLLNVRSTMGSVRGRWQDFRGTPVMPTFHPSYLLRSEDGPDRGFGEKRKTWTDMLQVLERLGRPITEKMRGYFAKPGSG